MGSVAYEIIFLRQSKKVLQRLPKDLLQRIRVTIQQLAETPRPPGCKKLVGHDNLYRLRVGGWRISYAVEDDRLVILIIEVSPRGNAYRSF